MDKSCRVCGSAAIEVVLSLEATPLEDQFLKEPKPQDVYPLDLALCTSCGYTFLPYKVSPSLSYSDYLYESKLTHGLRNYYEDYANEICTEFNLNSRSLVVDLGSNDGSMLEAFKRLGLKVLGVEPSRRLSNLANNLGLPTICGYFSDEIVEEIINAHGRASVVTANYMFANVEDVMSFTKRVAALLSHDGYFIVQTGYHASQFEKYMFDYIYHEHFSYFTVGVIDRIFRSAGLALVDVEHRAPKGGSVKLVGRLSSSEFQVKSSVHRMLDEERSLGLSAPPYYSNFKVRLAQRKAALVSKLAEIRNGGLKIAGFGASHSTTTLIYNFDLASYLDFIVDDNIAKHRTFSPGKHIPVYDASVLATSDVNFVLVLAWQHFDVIIERHSDLIDKGIAFIRPLPELKIVTRGKCHL